MKYLIDTQVLIWFWYEDNRLGPKARQLISDQAQQAGVSYVTAWEVAIKSSLGKIRLKRPLSTYIQQATFEWLPIRLEHFDQVALLPQLHRDPFDRLLIAQSQSENLILITGDKDVLGYPDVRLLNATL